ncbi:MAG: GntR family transcriptional regulator [Rhodospirillales bacterium]|nr:GntR family transcriptional regulator [Rhodospirillales bacterium]
MARIRRAPGQATQRHQAYEAFTRRLIDRELAPGQFVTPKELAEITGFRLNAIREMIPRLEAEGLLHAIPQRGLQVAQLDVGLVRDAFSLREMIEQTALAHFVAAAPEALIAGLIVAHAAVRDAATHGIDAGLIAEAQRVDWGFHDIVVDFLGNVLISDIHRVNAIRIRMMMPERVTLSEDTLPPAIAEHEVILEALRRRDGPAAAAGLAAHLASARRRALGIEPEPIAPPPQPPRRKP